MMSDVSLSLLASLSISRARASSRVFRLNMSYTLKGWVFVAIDFHVPLIV